MKKAEFLKTKKLLAPLPPLPDFHHASKVSVHGEPI
jgi:hypothetical protein